MDRNKFDEIFLDDPLGLLNVTSSESATERTPSEKRLIESFEEINRLKLKNTTNQRKEKIFKFSEEAYKLLSDKNVDEQIKYQVSHQLFEKIVYNKKENSIEITYK